MTSTPLLDGKTSANRYRLPGIEREGVAQLSLLETALWPLQGGIRDSNQFVTGFDFSTPAGRKKATVTVRAPSGLQPVDELILWGLLGATLSFREADPVLLATPYWMLRHLGLETGGSQYVELRESLLRLAFTSYQNDSFYNPETKEREVAAFQFLSVLLPTVGGVGETVDNERCWRIEWNPAFFRFCKATGGNLLFDMDVYRKLSPASRRLFLKLKDRFWRSKRVFMNVDDLTINGLGFAASRLLKKRKFDLKTCMSELLDHRIISLGRGQTAPEELFLKRGKGSYVVCFYEGEYFRQAPAERTLSQKNAILSDPLYEPLRRVGVDGPAIARILKKHKRGLIQRWLRVTDAAMHEKPRGFGGFRVSPAAFLIDGVENQRTLPDWMHEHEKRQEKKRWHNDIPQEADDRRVRYEAAKTKALQEFLASDEGRATFEKTLAIWQAFFKVTDPNRAHASAHQATMKRIQEMDLRFPSFEDWVVQNAN